LNHASSPNPAEQTPNRSGLAIKRLTLTRFRNHASLTLEPGPGPVVLVGPNGAGKTNILEAVSLLAAGQGLRRAPFPELANATGDGSWAVAARLTSRQGEVSIGTGLSRDDAARGPRTGRIVRIDGETRRSSGILAEYVDCVWVTPAMDGLFTGPASERRRFIDRLVLSFDPAFRTLAGRFEKAMQNRNRLLASETAVAPAQFAASERIMAETATAIAAARNETLQALAGTIAARRERNPDSAFPWSELVLKGTLENELTDRPAIEVEDAYTERLAASRNRDRAAARTLEGPHRSDLEVRHGPKQMDARLCSTGEQKSLLLGLVLAQAELIARRHDGAAPLLLLDEITAHLDTHRRAALFEEIERLGAQSWMTGTDLSAFEALGANASRFEITPQGPRPIAT